MPWDGLDYVDYLLQSVPPKYMAAASLTTLVYDNLITLDQEIATVWRSNWSTGKILFLLNRYFTLIVSSVGLVAQIHPNPSFSFCSPWYFIEAFASIFGLVIVQIILMLRTYALYKRSRVVLFSLFALCAVCSGSMTILAGLFCTKVFFHDNPLPALVGPNIIGLGCLKDCHGCLGLLQAFYVPMLVFDGTIFVLTFISAVQYSRENIHVAFLTMLYRDGFLYFTVIFATSLSNLIIWTVVTGPQVESLLPVIRAMLSIMCSRLMLNIRVTITRHAPRRGYGDPEVDLSEECVQALDIQLERFEAKSRGVTFAEQDDNVKGMRRAWRNQRLSASGVLGKSLPVMVEDASEPMSPTTPITPGTGMSDRTISIIPLLSNYHHRSRQVVGGPSDAGPSHSSNGSSPTSTYPPSEANINFQTHSPSPEPEQEPHSLSSSQASFHRRIVPLQQRHQDVIHSSTSHIPAPLGSRPRRLTSLGTQARREPDERRRQAPGLSRSQTMPSHPWPRHFDPDEREPGTVLDEMDDAEEHVEVEVEVDRPGRISGESSEEERERRLREWQEEWEWNWKDKWRSSISANR